uniref:Uncharacterized protein n=1 Tax=Picea sitchensis TaxID=3332 RepID=A0A6B9XPC5_PICSI|nr:hypothetical protein Q903MT_gene3756 [Picea sitchensis]
MTWDLDPELLLSLSLVLVLRNKQDQQVMLLNGNISASSQANDIYLSTQASEKGFGEHQNGHRSPLLRSFIYC